MKKSMVLLIIALLLTAVLSACGGGNSTTPETAAEVPAVVEDAAEAVVEADTQPLEAEDEAEAETQSAEAPVVEEAAAESGEAAEPVDASADLAMSGIDPDTGLEINPPVTQPGTDYIIRGNLSSFNLIPQDSPEFLIDAGGGLRFRVQTQPVPEIYLADGTQLALHEIVRGLPVQATARLTESDRATSVMVSPNMVILSATP